MSEPLQRARSIFFFFISIFAPPGNDRYGNGSRFTYIHTCSLGGGQSGVYEHGPDGHQPSRLHRQLTSFHGTLQEDYSLHGQLCAVRMSPPPPALEASGVVVLGETSTPIAECGNPTAYMYICTHLAMKACGGIGWSTTFPSGESGRQLMGARKQPRPSEEAFIC